MKWSAGNYNIHVARKKKNIHSPCICCLKSYRGTSKFINSIFGSPNVCVNSSFFGCSDGLEKSMFEELKENLRYRFFSFSQKQIFRYVCVSVPNCSSVEDGDFEKVSPISKIMFKNFLRQFKTKPA